jgi:hypothetical protein
MMRIRIPSKKVCERFFLIYELEGCQEAVDFLSRHYGIRRMKITLDGRKAGVGNRACYVENKAYFTRRGLNKRFVLHEFYHHLVEAKGWEMPNSIEEENARSYAREFLRSRCF